MQHQSNQVNISSENSEHEGPSDVACIVTRVASQVTRVADVLTNVTALMVTLVVKVPFTVTIAAPSGPR